MVWYLYKISRKCGFKAYTKHTDPLKGYNSDLSPCEKDIVVNDKLSNRCLEFYVFILLVQRNSLPLGY